MNREQDVTYKGRELDTGTRVFVYYNLHSGTWSVKALEGPHKGKVCLHARHVILEDAFARVSVAGQRRVIREQRKNVHAGVVGNILYASNQPLVAANDHNPTERVSYNPYRGAYFYYVSDGTPWDRLSPLVTLWDKRVWVHTDNTSGQGE